jgi:hypothetical protein
MAFGSVVLWLLVVLMGLQIGAGLYSEPHELSSGSHFVSAAGQPASGRPRLV